MSRLIGVLIFIVSITALTGCASYRVTSNIGVAEMDSAKDSAAVIITEGDIKDRNYETIKEIVVSVKKATLFHKDPTIEQARIALIEKAKAIGADAVIRVHYKSGIGAGTWGYTDAKGTAIRFTE